MGRVQSGSMRTRAQRMLVEIDKTFRLRVLKLKGSKKGTLGEAVSEALSLWLDAHPEEENENN